MTTSNKPFPTTPLARLTDHNGPVHAVAFSAGTGQYLLTGCQDRTVRLFNPATRRLVQKYGAHGYEVLDLAVSADNARFVSVGGDKAVFLWDVATAQTLRRFGGHAARVHCCAFGGDDDSVVLSGSFDGTVKLWDARSRNDRAPLMTLGDARDAVSALAVRAHQVFVASVDGRVRVYDLAAGALDVDVVGPATGAGLTSVCPTQAADAYLVSSLDSTLRFLDRATGQCLQTFRDPEGLFTNEVYRVRSTLAVGEAYAVSGSEDGRVVVWDVLTGAVVHRLWHTEHGGDGGERNGGADGKRVGSKEDVVSATAWNPTRKQWASAGGDGSVVVWGFE